MNPIANLFNSIFCLAVHVWFIVSVYALDTVPALPVYIIANVVASISAVVASKVVDKLTERG